MSAGQVAVVTEADARAAQTILDALEDAALASDTADGYRLTARGILTSWAADLRQAGWLEAYQYGLQEGRRDVAHWVRAALEGEGL